LLRKCGLEGDGVDHAVIGAFVRALVVAFVGADAGLEGLLGRLEPDRQCQLARHRRVEVQAHRSDWQAGRLRILTFTTEVGGKGLAHLKVEPGLDRIRYAAGRGHTLAPHQLHLGRGRESPVARQRDDLKWIGFGGFGQALRLEQVGTFFAVDEPHRHALA
jgi:hypothetical protein